MIRSMIIVLCSLFLFTKQTVHAEETGYALHGKVDLAATILDVDILESGKTVETLHMKGAKGDATILVWKGFCLKPGFIVGKGKGRLAAYNIGVGHYFPINEKLLLIPSIGVSLSDLHTRVDFKELKLSNLKEKFHSKSLYLAIEVCYQIAEKWTLMGLYQYAWSRTHTTIKPLVSDKSHSEGSNYGLAVDYNFLPNWSMTFGVGYNISLSKEKHGIRAKGAKLGLAYYF